MKCYMLLSIKNSTKQAFDGIFEEQKKMEGEWSILLLNYFFGLEPAFALGDIGFVEWVWEKIL